jgi:purine-binding chemotaxis protein CheW
MSTLHVICRIGEARYAIPADEVYQMESFEGVTPVPGAAPYVAGLVQSRQHVIPVLDARTRFGLPPAESRQTARVIVLELGKRLVGIIVDDAREVQDIAPEQFRPAPEIVARTSAGFVRSVAQLEDRIVMLLDSEKLAFEEALDAAR